MLRFVRDLNLLIAVLFTVAYAYQLFYILIGLWDKRHAVHQSPARLHKFAAVVSARNEENVIGELIQSLRAQQYPAELFDIFVVADNCTDRTAECARAAGAYVYERTNTIEVGKGYALDFLFHHLWEEFPNAGWEGYFVFDADNLVDPAFVSEMNRTFDKGDFDAITCYRNSKNFGANWISAGYSIWFLREARFLNAARCRLGTNCAVSGTGFLVSDRVLRKNGGWPFHLLTEDIEFSVACAADGNRIGYCDRAMVYDEQPTAFGQSWDQRLRWSKGFYQIDVHYTLPLLRGMFRGGRNAFSCYDLLMTVAPGMLITLAAVVVNLFVIGLCWTQPDYISRWITREVIRLLLTGAANFYFGMFFYGALTVFSEWRQIHATRRQKIAYLFSFPIFMLTYIPIAVAALLKKVEWKPIWHTPTHTAQEYNKAA